MNKYADQPHSNPADQQEFLRVFLANEREILRYVVALVPNLADAQEIVQQTAVVLWEKFDHYDRSRPFAPWACRFALNVTRQWMDRRKRWKALLEDGLAEELALRREQLRSGFDTRLVHLDQCLQKLPEHQRSLVDGYYFRQLGIEAVAGQAQRTADAVYKALQRIRRQLRECIERSLREETGT
jgi:RNA polymerase sigma-70 factor (ECF subfamily)